MRVSPRTLIALGPLALLVASVGRPGGPPSSAAQVSLIGDSVPARIEQLPEAAYALEDRLRINVDTAVCRRLAQRSCGYSGVRPTTALQAIEALPRPLPAVIVLMVGYNETPLAFARGARTVMTLLAERGERHVLWVTLRERQQSNAVTNRVIRAVAKRWPRLAQVVDWNAVSTGKPWFETDGVHLNTEGAVALARLIRAHVLSACGRECLWPVRPPLQPIPRGSPVCVEHAGGPWAAVLSTARTAAGALASQRRAIGQGFTQSLIVQATPSVYEIVVFGFPSRAEAVGVYLEAKSRGFRATAAPNLDRCGDESGSWRAIFGHTRTLAEAQTLRARVSAVGFRDGLQLDTDRPSDFEVAVTGLQSTSQLPGFQADALKRGFIVSFEPS